MKKYIFILSICFLFLSTASYAQNWLLIGNSGTNPSTNFIGTKDNQPLVFRINNTERMRILSNGKIGIGTSTPSQRLDINGNINLGKGSSLYMENHPILRVDSLKNNTFLGNSIAPHVTGSENSAVGAHALFLILPEAGILH
jgi:hypothetical protein